MAMWTTDFLQWSPQQKTVRVGMFYLYYIEYKFIWTYEIIVIYLWIRCVLAIVLFIFSLLSNVIFRGLKKGEGVRNGHKGELHRKKRVMLKEKLKGLFCFEKIVCKMCLPKKLNYK